MDTTRYQMVKCTPRADHPPEYLRDVSLKEIFAYYFNWHTEEATANIEAIKQWFKEARGWCWQEL